MLSIFRNVLGGGVFEGGDVFYNFVSTHFHRILRPHFPLSRHLACSFVLHLPSLPRESLGPQNLFLHSVVLRHLSSRLAAGSVWLAAGV